MRIDEKAEQQGLAGPKAALHDLATWMRNNQEACRSTFGSTAVETTVPACVSGDASGYGPLVAGRQWAIPGTFSGGTAASLKATMAAAATGSSRASAS